VLLEESGDFSHPRMLIGRFQTAEKLLQAALKKAYANRFLPQRPVLIMHPKEILEGGLTEIEERVFQELGLGAGAREVKIWLGADLDAEGVKNFRLQK
jgi:rod shape-determining protein MreB